MTNIAVSAKCGLSREQFNMFLFCLFLFGGYILSTGSYDEFEMSNETDVLEQFLKMAPPAPEPDAAKNEVCADN